MNTEYDNGSLKYLHTTNSVIPRSAKYDRIEISIRNIQVIGTEAELEKFYKELCMNPDLEGELHSMEPGSPYRLHFCHFSQPYSRRREFRIRESIKNGEGASCRALVSGKLTTIENNGRVDIRATLFLNPTRYVAYIPLVRRSVISKIPSRWELPRPPVYATSQPYNGQEIVLDGNDNAILTSARLAFARPAAWPLHLANYLHAVETGLREALESAVQFTGAQLLFDSINIRLRSVEVYWEFQASDAISETTTLFPRLECVASQSSSYMPREERDQNSIGKRLTLQKNVQLRVYSKTQQRIRFEFVFGKKSLPARPEVSSLALLGSRDGILSRLADRASHILNRILPILEKRSRRRSGGPGRLLEFIQACSPHPHVVMAIQGALIELGRIDTTSHPDIRAAAQILRRRGVLNRAFPRCPVMQVQPHWERALAILSS